LIGGLLCVAALGAGTAYATGLGKESTDDAQMEGRVITISARVPGQVSRVLVQDNQLVQAGDVILELDPADYRSGAARGGQRCIAPGRSAREAGSGGRKACEVEL
jgi:membrane fusion protein (multidrug efflux system)